MPTYVKTFKTWQIDAMQNGHFKMFCDPVPDQEIEKFLDYSVGPNETLYKDCVIEWLSHGLDGPGFYAHNDIKVGSGCQKIEPRYKVGEMLSVAGPSGMTGRYLKITSVKCDRLRNITEQSAFDCGAPSIRNGDAVSTRAMFREKWQRVYGRDSWHCNPWVFIYGVKQT